MRTRLHSLLLPATLLLLCFAAPLQAQDAAKILKQYVGASGGARALSKIQTITLEGTVAAQNGAKPGAYTFDVKLPNRYYSEMVMGGQAGSNPSTANPRGIKTPRAKSRPSSALKACNSKPPRATTIRASSIRRRIS